MENIEELIADAKAEEEVMEKQKEEQFKADLRNGLQNFFYKRNEEEKQNINIPLSEYLVLKIKERDLNIVINAITETLSLDYDKKSLKVYDGSKELIINTFKTLYRYIYDAKLEELQQEEGEE